MKKTAKQPTRNGTPGLTEKVSDQERVQSIGKKEAEASIRDISKPAISTVCFSGFNKQPNSLYFLHFYHQT